MQNSDNSSNPLSLKIPKWLAWGFLLASFVGFLDASYLTVKYYAGTPITCSLLEGCEQVTTSQYATVLGIPVALFGAAYYLFILLTTIYFFDSRKESVLSMIAPVTVIGLFVSLYLVYLQLFVIHAICIYCMLSALTSTILFLLGVITLRSTR